MKRRSKVRATAAKARRPKSARLKRQSVPNDAARLASHVAGEESEIARLTRERNEAREQQTAASEVLQVISTSPGDLEPVFAAILERAVRICGAAFGNIYRRDGDALQLVATHNTPPAFAEYRRRTSHVTTCYQSHGGGQINCSRGRYGRRAGLCRTRTDDGGSGRTWARADVCGRPMVKENELIGGLILCCQEVRPFTDKQIELVKSFAAQAVIAIENARLLNELRQRTDDLSQRTTDLTEALDQQTAMSEVLQVISSSPGELQPVFAAMLEKAVRICGAKFGIIYRREDDGFHLVATHNLPPAYAEARRRSPQHGLGLEFPPRSHGGDQSGRSRRRFAIRKGLHRTARS